jgi:single-strand DNA-binding protein
MPSVRLPNLNRVLIVGNLTKDPELRSTSTGVSVANFRIASNRRFKDNSGEWREDVCYIGVVAWQKLAEACADRLTKGSAIYVEGELRSRSLDSDDGNKRNIIEIRANYIQFLDKIERTSDEDSENVENIENSDKSNFERDNQGE